MSNKVLLFEANYTVAASLEESLVYQEFAVRTETNHQKLEAAIKEFDPDVVVINPHLGHGSYDLALVKKATAQKGPDRVIIYTIVVEGKQEDFRRLVKHLGVTVCFFGQQIILLDTVRQKMKR